MFTKIKTCLTQLHAFDARQLKIQVTKISEICEVCIDHMFCEVPSNKTFVIGMDISEDFGVLQKTFVL